MRAIWNIVSFLATVHLLAIVLVIAWLWQNDRLNTQRIHNLRELFATTITEDAEANKAAEEEAAAETARMAQEQRDADPPVDSKSHIQHASTVRLHEEQALRRLEQEKLKLLEQLMTVTAQLNRQREEINREKSQLLSVADEEAKRKNDEQFRLIVRQYEQLPPKQGKRMLMELVSQNQRDQAVSYLLGMSPRASSKILKEFKTEDEIALATELLERMRTHGEPPGASQEIANASSDNPRAQ
jgi:hypothetical protein